MGVVVILLFTLNWHLMRYEDRRFVGTWIVTTPRISGISWELSSLGSGTAYTPQRKMMVTFGWSVQGDLLVFSSHNQEKQIYDRLTRSAEIARQKVLNEPTYAERYEILSISPDVITLRDVDSTDILTLRRLSH
jgi:hypothetical protein